MSLNRETAKAILKNSIRSAVCIDDEYLSPYEEKQDRFSDSEPRELYYSFREKGHCDLDIYRFESWDKSWQEHMIYNKDLMILDWELDKEGKKYESTLKILNATIASKKIPFVVVYTHTEDLNLVSQVILKSYNSYSSGDYDKLIEALKEKFQHLSEDTDEIEFFLEGNETIFYEFLHHHSKRKEIASEIVDNIKTFLSIDNDKKERIPNKIRTALSEHNPTDFTEALVILSNIIFSKERKAKDNKFKTERIEIEKNCYLIDGVIVLILHKQNDVDGVAPDNLFEVFSEAISSAPHSIINLLSLELKDKFREDFAAIGTKFNTISKTAFTYHAKNYFRTPNDPASFDKTAFHDFVKQTWINELYQYNLDIELKSLQLAEAQFAEEVKENSTLENDLARYAYMVSCVELENRNNTQLTFGDVFVSDSCYFLCITPLCDCLRPDKIKHNFYFVAGEKANLKTALEKAESGFYSFVKNSEEFIAVEWKCKPFTLFLPDEKNNIGNLVCNYSGKEYKLKYLTILKENYAQRIANNSFGYGYRIGIDLPRLRNGK